MPALSAIGDLTLGEDTPCKFPPTAIINGSPTVFVNGKAVATVGSNVFLHFCFVGDKLVAHKKRVICSGSPTVFVNGSAAARIGSTIEGITTPEGFPPCTDTVAQGSPNVFVG